MSTFIAVSLTCWLCTMVAVPRKPQFGNEIAELVYARLLGRHHRLALLAVCITAALVLTIIVSLPGRMDANAHAAMRTTVSTPCEEVICPWLYGQ